MRDKTRLELLSEEMPSTHTDNPTKEQEFATEVAKYLVGQETPTITAKELEAVAKKLGYEDIEGIISYVQSPEGADFFKKAIRFELWKAGYLPRR